MIKLTVTNRAGETNEITTAGGTLMQAITDAGLEDIFGICGGACACASCHVILDENVFAVTGPAGADESELLASSDFRAPTSRLSCQIQLTGVLNGLRATIAPEG